jgi:hypothetical protein
MREVLNVIFFRIVQQPFGGVKLKKSHVYCWAQRFIVSSKAVTRHKGFIYPFVGYKPMSISGVDECLERGICLSL